MKLFWNVAFYLAVVVIVVVAVFPFYYAIVTSFKTGTALFEVDYWPTQFDWSYVVSRVSCRDTQAVAIHG